MRLSKSVLCALLVLSTSFQAFADQGRDHRGDQYGDHRNDGRDGRYGGYGDHTTDPWGNRHDRYDQSVEVNLQKYLDQYSSLDLLIDSYMRNQLLGKKISSIQIALSSESGRDSAQLLFNGRAIEAPVIVARQTQVYTFRVDQFSNEIGRSLRSISLETRGRFYVDKVIFQLASNDNHSGPIPLPTKTEVVRQQVNQRIQDEGGLELFRLLSLQSRQGAIVKRVNVIASSDRGYGQVMLLENTQNYGQSQTISGYASRISFDLTSRETIGRDLQSLRLQFRGSITILEVSVELETSGYSQPQYPQYPSQPQTPSQPQYPSQPQRPTDPRQNQGGQQGQGNGGAGQYSGDRPTNGDVIMPSNPGSNQGQVGGRH
jgi:hypothetical protein